MKKIIILIITISIICSIFFIGECNTCYAEENNSSIGYDLEDGYDIEISYANFNMYNGSIVRSFIFTIDDDFYFSEDNTPFGNLLGFLGIDLEVNSGILNYLSDFMLAIGYTPQIDENGRVIGSMNFDSPTDMYISYGIDGYEAPSENDSTVEKSFFYEDITSMQKTIFEDIEEKGNALNDLLVGLENYGITSNRVTLSYSYGTPYKTISSDAEEKYFDNDNKIFIHKFVMNLDTKDREIVFIQHIPNVANWYIFGLCVAIIIALITVLFAIKFKKRFRQ